MNWFQTSGESGALPCMGQILSRQFLEKKLLVVYAQENARLFLVWPTIVQRIQLQNVCNLIEKNPGLCFTSAFEFFFLRKTILDPDLKLGFCCSKFTVKKLTLLRQLWEACSFYHVEYFNPEMKYFENTCVGQIRACAAGAYLCQ